MANPSPTARSTPGGIYLKDGYQSLVTFANDPDISFWEKSVQPPGYDGGDPIDTTSMHNSTYHTMRAQTLILLTEGTIAASYDPDLVNQIIAIMNVETTVTATFADGSTEAFYGYLRTFTREPLVIGEQPMCNIGVQPTSWDPANNVEAPPLLTSVAGS